MVVTRFDNLSARGATAKYLASLPDTPAEYYGEYSNAGANIEWVGGELVYLTTHQQLYINTATSGATAAWKRLLDTFVTSTSTSTSTSTTSTSSTTSSSSSTSTSTSSSSSTSTSTSTSSTTTA